MTPDARRAALRERLEKKASTACRAFNAKGTHYLLRAVCSTCGESDEAHLWREAADAMPVNEAVPPIVEAFAEWQRITGAAALSAPSPSEAEQEIVRLQRTAARLERERDNWKWLANAAEADAANMRAERDALAARVKELEEALEKPYALELAAYLGFIHGKDIDSTVERARANLVERALRAEARVQELETKQAITCADECNPYVASCGARFCTYEAMAHHEGQHKAAAPPAGEEQT